MQITRAGFLKMTGLATMGSMVASPVLAIADEPAEASDASETAGDEYLYGYTAMSYADFWYGELEQVEPVDGFDLDSPDTTALSDGYLHYGYSSADDEDRFAGKQKETWDNDSGMYDVVSRATVGYGLFRSSFANIVEAYLDNGDIQTFNCEIFEDSDEPTGFHIEVNTEGVPGIVLTANSRIDTEATTGYTPNPDTVFAQSVENGGGYQICGLKRVPVKVKASVVSAAQELAAQGIDNEQLQAFNAQLEGIEFVDQMTSFACKELYANGIFGPREANPAADVKNPGAAYLGTGENKTKKTSHTDGYADITMYVYLDAYDGYTRGSLTSLDEASMDTLYQKDENPSTYAENKEAGDKMAAFMDYALNFQGAKLQWAGPDGVFDTDDDVFAGNMIHKDSYFSFNHGNYIEVSITSDFERFSQLGNGDYRITLISEGYEDVTVEATELKLDYRAPILVSDDVPAMDGSRVMSYQLDVSQMHVSDDDAQQEAYLADLQDPSNYNLRYQSGEGRNKQEIVLAEAASQIVLEDGVLTVSFDLSGADEVPEDIHYLSSINSTCACADSIEVEFHYAPTA